MCSRTAAEQDLPPSGFCIAITAKKIRRLHFVGSCWRVPGEHYKTFSCWGEVLPPVHEIDVVCSTCFPGGDVKRPETKVAEVEEEECSSSSSSSSSPSAASSDKPRAKKRKGATGAASAP